MAIDNPNVIDGMAIDEDRKAICLLLTDHFAWNGNDTLSEYDHLILLQEKINAYISYLDTRQYEEQYPKEEIVMAIIEIHFKYDITSTIPKLNIAFSNNSYSDFVSCLVVLGNSHLGVNSVKPGILNLYTTS